VNKQEDLLMVYTMGKVASTTISEAIEQAGLVCFDVHTLIKSGLLNDLKNFAAAEHLPPKHFGQSLAILQDFDNPAQRVKIITCVRDPFARNLSAVFQNLPVNASVNLVDVTARLEKTNPDKPGAWMRKDFLKSTGINLLSLPFDPTKGYARYQEGRFDILVLRVDLDDQSKTSEISKFVGREVLLERKNDATDKWYESLYRDYLANGRIKQEWVEACVNSAYARHYFSPEELLRMRTKAERFFK
jgi:hypothetical protein